MHSSRYIMLFVVAMTSIVALGLALMYTSLKPVHTKNESIYNKRAILAAVNNYLEKPVEEMSDEEIQSIFDNNIDQYVVDMNGEIVPPEEVEARGYPGGQAEDVDMAKERKKPEPKRILPVFEYTQNGNQLFIVSIRGSGLWDEIWGNIALESDFNTIAGAAFDHKAETPGLGAEIKDNPNFSKQFIDKKLYEDDGDYVSVEVVKGDAPDDAEHKVDGITGATITANGVTEMMDRGIAYYQPFFQKKKT